MSYLIGTAVCGWVIISFYPRLIDEWKKNDRNLALLAGQIVFLLLLVILGLTGIFLWWSARSP